MDNKGFTLIELILVISVLAMIGLLSIPNIVKMLEKNKVDNYNGTIDSIRKAAELYASDNRYELDFDSEFCKPTDTNSKNIVANITLQTLIDSKDISSSIKNFCTDKDINVNTGIRIILNCGTKQFSIDIDEGSSSGSLKRRTGINGIDGIKIEKGKYCDSLY